MPKKIYQVDFFLMPDNELWMIYILLHKGKDYYYEVVGRSTEELPNQRGNYTYEHALFTLEGKVLAFHQKMRPSLITYAKQTILNNQDKFRKEIDMTAKSTYEKKVQFASNELGQLLKKKDYSQAWTKAGELNSLLKKEEASSLKPELVEQLHTEIKGYYYINSEMEKLNKRFFAKGNKLIELSNL